MPNICSANPTFAAMTRQQLISAIRQKQSFLCIGLDPDLSKLPPSVMGHENPVLEFCRQIIEATHHLCVAYKPNTAFFEALGPEGWKTLAQVRELIPSHILTIADAKRGDIGNTSNMYASAFFDRMNYDAVTVAPYMGRDSVEPFLNHPGKWAVVLGLTSNPGAADFELIPDAKGTPLYKHVLQTVASWGTNSNTMFVIGATRAEMLTEVRQIVPDHFLLVPGVGTQGGSLSEVARYGLTSDCGLLVNASRSIIYASNGPDFALHAKAEAEKMQHEMAALLA